MKSHSSLVIRFFAVAALSSGCGLAQAVFQDCTISGRPGVILSTGTPGAEGSETWRLRYDLQYQESPEYSVKPIVQVYRESVVAGRGTQEEVACTSEVNSTSTSLELDGCGLRFTKVAGSHVFNAATFTNGKGRVSGYLVDASGDGLADTMALQVSYPGAPAARMDVPLQYYPATGTPTHWHLPQNLPWGGGTFFIGTNFYTPVNAANQTIDVSLGGTQLFVTGLKGVMTSNAIPTASFWGYALVVLLLALVGIGMLRQRGFGDDLHLRA